MASSGSCDETENTIPGGQRGGRALLPNFVEPAGLEQPVITSAHFFTRRSMNDTTFTRRDLHRLALAALGGLTAGALVGCSGGATKPGGHGQGPDGKRTRTARTSKP